MAKEIYTDENGNRFVVDYNPDDYTFIGDIPEDKLPEAYQIKIPTNLPYILRGAVVAIIIFGIIVIRYFIITW